MIDPQSHFWEKAEELVGKKIMFWQRPKSRATFFKMNQRSSAAQIADEINSNCATLCVEPIGAHLKEGGGAPDQSLNLGRKSH